MTSRKVYCWTWNNYPENWEELLPKNYRYICYAPEIGDKGTPHIQGFIRYENKKSWDALRKEVDGWFILKDPVKGTDMDNRTYIFGPYEDKETGKTKPFNPLAKEFGKMSSQGKRTDLIKIKNKIFSGATTVDDIVLDKPMVYHQYGRTLNKIEDLAMRRRHRCQMTTCEWLWGPTGSGKSHRAFENYNENTHYVVPNDGGWWDGYKQQEIVIINEFRGSIAYGELLQLIDKWPYSVRRRNREPMPFTSKHIIITSSMRPEDVYHNLSEHDKLDQLLRRIVVILIGGHDPEVLGGVIREIPPSKNMKILKDLEGQIEL